MFQDNLTKMMIVIGTESEGFCYLEGGKSESGQVFHVGQGTSNREKDSFMALSFGPSIFSLSRASLS